MENGDVITAQQCLNGREFNPEEMSENRAAKLLKKIDDSRPLLTMLQRMGKKAYEPAHMLLEVEETLDQAIQSIDIVDKSLTFLTREVSV